MKQKKNGLFTFLFSLIPGAAEMYTGFMKNGTSLMGMFMLCIMVPVYLKLGAVFLCPAILAWFYSFFHARNMARRSAEEIAAMPDVYIWEEVTEDAPKHKDLPLHKWTPYVLIICGVLILWNCVVYITDLVAESRVLHLILVNLPQAVIAFLVIFAGLRLKKQQKKLAALQAPATEETLPVVAAEPVEVAAVQPVQAGPAEEAVPAAPEAPAESPAEETPAAAADEVETVEAPAEEETPAEENAPACDDASAEESAPAEDAEPAAEE